MGISLGCVMAVGGWSNPLKRLPREAGGRHQPRRKNALSVILTKKKKSIGISFSWGMAVGGWSNPLKRLPREAGGRHQPRRKSFLPLLVIRKVCLLPLA